MEYETFTPEEKSAFEVPEKSGVFSGMKRSIVAALAALVAFVLLSLFLLSAPRSFGAPRIFTIASGSSLVAISHQLKSEKMIRSETLFQVFAILFSGDKKVLAGDYAFDRAAPVYIVAWRISHGSYGISRKKVTIPEGSTSYEAARIFEKNLIGFDVERFLALTDGKEGYLFPDTYFVFSNTPPEEIAQTMEDTFITKTAKIRTDIAASGKSLSDLIIMASIIEKEANKPDDRRVVSGILWKRIKLGMALQVDAPFLYIDQKDGEREVTLDDLKTDSLYNTYTHRGLPPTPIGNPGLDSIVAAFEPKTSPYLYYLHDAEGNIHYARTFEEHKANKEKYIWNN